MQKRDIRLQTINMRRSFIIAAIVIVLAGIGVFAYFYFFSSRADLTVAPEGSAGFPVAGQGALFPDGSSAPAGAATAPVAVSARLVKISSGPVVPGIVAANLPAPNASSSPGVSIRYIERQSGNIFSYSAQARATTRTSNKTIPGIQSAAWLPDASAAFVRYLSGDDSSTINTYTLLADGSGGSFLPQNLADIAVSKASVLTLASGANGSVASLRRPDGSRALELFTTPLSAVHVSFAGTSSYLAYTKPSATLEGYAFLVNAAGRFSRVVGPLRGLVALASPSGKWIMVSYTTDSTMKLELVNAATGEIVPLPVATIADKCVWAADDTALYCGIPVSPASEYTYPDDWYQGAAHFNDRIWKIDVASRYTQLILDFSNEAGDSLDATALALDPLGTTLVFVNKNDGSLWSYQL